jgi:hypothetical protein
MIARPVGIKVSRRRASSQAPSPLQPPPYNTLDYKETPTEVHPRERSNEEIQWPDSVTGDARVQLIKQQRLGTLNPQKKPRRIKTEQLPLETIPHDSETCTLLMTITADVGRVAQLLTKVYRFDPWLLDGRLRGGFEDLTSPEDMAKLVEPLLAQIRQGRAVTT